MSGQFDKETSRQNFEWHRKRALQEKKNPTKFSPARMEFNIKAIQQKHGNKAAKEIIREIQSK